jgi:hypothetical protein
MKPCGGCAKRREMLKAALRKVVGAANKPAPDDTRTEMPMDERPENSMTGVVSK